MPNEPDFLFDPAGAIEYAEGFMRLLGHLPGNVHVTRAGASMECQRPGCNMGLTIDPDKRPQVQGSAVQWCCAAPKA